MKLVFGLMVLFLSGFAINACSEPTVEAIPVAAKIEAWQANWVMNPSESAVTFTAIYTGESFEGHFGRFDAKIKFNPDDLEHSKVVARIDLASVDAGETERTEALPGKEWFYVKSFPEAVFESTQFTHLTGGEYEVQGNLTLRGTTKALTFPFTLHIENGKANMEGSLRLNRRDFNVGTGMWKSASDVSHEVNVHIKVSATQT